ncbi:hypothetical protein E4K72_11265 [Oxalobacteraceae bacterium OM1]|nr:hypothetical protein E4K72_11265 [Oxalobacteraceae bacterium OM1]
MLRKLQHLCCELPIEGLRARQIKGVRTRIAHASTAGDLAKVCRGLNRLPLAYRDELYQLIVDVAPGPIAGTKDVRDLIALADASEMLPDAQRLVLAQRLFEILPAEVGSEQRSMVFDAALVQIGRLDEARSRYFGLQTAAEALKRVPAAIRDAAACDVMNVAATLPEGPASHIAAMVNEPM